MLVLSNADAERVLTMSDCLEVLEPAFCDLGRGEAANRPRSHTYTPLDETSYYLFKSMDGSLPRLGVHALRLSSDHVRQVRRDGGLRREKVPLAPGNRFVGLVLLFSVQTLEPLAVLQDGYLQKMRVGATSALAAKHLARPDATAAGVIGAGWQADAQILGLDSVRRLRRIAVYAPTQAHREDLCARLQPQVNAELRPVAQPREAVDGCDIVACSTNSLTPVFDGSWLVPGQHVNSVQRGELDDDTHGRADVIVTRARETTLHFAAGGARPQEMDDGLGGWHAEWQPKLRELGKVMAGLEQGRTSPAQITLFGGSGTGPSSGLGLQFAAVGWLIWQRAREQGLGHEVPTDWFLEDVHP